VTAPNVLERVHMLLLTRADVPGETADLGAHRLDARRAFSR
jgi:hypothetical protein